MVSEFNANCHLAKTIFHFKMSEVIDPLWWIDEVGVVAEMPTRNQIEPDQHIHSDGWQNWHHQIWVNYVGGEAAAAATAIATATTAWHLSHIRFVF